MSEYREAFVQTLRVGADMRQRAFDVIEQRHAKDFENGPAGARHYADILDAVRDADVPEALDEFQRRFAPLLDPDGSRRAAREAREAAAKAAQERAAAGETPSRRGWWQWLAVVVAAALLALGLVWLIIPRAPVPEPLPPPRPEAVTPTPETPAPSVLPEETTPIETTTDPPTEPTTETSTETPTETPVPEPARE